jgi:hypothetical protein
MTVDDAPDRPKRSRAPLWAGLAAALVGGAVFVGSVVPSALITGAFVEAQQQRATEGYVSAVEQGVVDTLVTEASTVAAEIEARGAAYRDASLLWTDAESAIATWRSQDEAPTPQVANPGGPGFPGGDADERALLERIGASAVQVIFDSGEDNCGYQQGLPTEGFLAVGGCYNPSYRNWLFLAWDEGIEEAEVWPVFVHEAMHWYQWDRYATLFEAAERSGVTSDRYTAQIESDASCRAVFQHGVARSEYDNSSAPCDVDDWYDGWLVDQLAALGVPTAAPDPAAYEVQDVVRP